MLAQHKVKQVELVHLTIEKQSLSTILDSFVMLEERCTYYNSKLIFSISQRNYEDDFEISIGSHNDSNILLSSRPFGYFIHQDHTFIVDGAQCEEIFSTLEEKRIFKYIEYDPFYKEKGKKQVIYYYTDDSYTLWNFLYANNELLFESKWSPCDLKIKK